MVQTMTVTIQDFEQSNQALQQDVEKLNALNRLLQNPDFISVIGEGYLHDEAVRLVHARPDMFGSRPEAVEGIDRQIAAIGEFRNFLRKVDRDGVNAIEQIAENNANIAELAGAGAQ